MTIEELKELFKGDSPDISKTIEALKKGKKLPPIDQFKKLYDPYSHDVFDTVLRPKKTVRDDQGNESLQDVNRIGVPYQEMIVDKAVSFCFGNPVLINCETSGEDEKLVLKALKKILHDNKIDSFNRQIARDLFRCTEIAEIWYPVKKEKHNTYGFETELKLRSSFFSPWNGNELYPKFDDTGDMIAFSRGWQTDIANDKKISYFETYTEEFHIIWKKEDGGADWTQVSNTANTIKKIPVIYADQVQTEWYGVQTLIDRYEKLVSNLAETNDYHSDPKIFITGELKGFAKKGQQGAILQGEKESKAEYLSWDKSPESVKLEHETLKNNIYTFSQTVDLSLGDANGAHDLSGEALKMFFLDAHLKVQKKREILDVYLQRRINVISAYISQFNLKLKPVVDGMEIIPEIQPFIIADDKALIDLLTSASGGKELISQKTAIARSGLVEDIEQEYKLIQEETDRAATTSFQNVTI